MSRPIDTLVKKNDSGKIFQVLLNHQVIDEVLFPQKFLKSNLPFINLKELSHGHIQNVPPIIGAHPLAVLRGVSGDGSDVSGIIDSKLPLIGVEQMATRPEKITLGVHQTQKYALTQEFVDILEAVPHDERMFTQTMIDNIKTVMNERLSLDPPQKLFMFANSYIKSTGTKISIWTATFEATHLLKKAIESLIIEFYRAIQEFGVKPQEFTLEPSLYNFDTTGEMLYGAEFSLPFFMRNMNYIIDIDMVEIQEFDFGVFETQSCFFLSPFGDPDETFRIGVPGTE